MRFQIILITTVLFALSGHSQNYHEDKDILGFACKYRGAPTRPVYDLQNALGAQKYGKVRRYLKSSNNVYNYLGAVTCEYLDSLGLIDLRKREIKLIQKLKAVDTKIKVCHGCAYRDEVKLSELLQAENSFRKSCIERIERSLSQPNQ